MQAHSCPTTLVDGRSKSFSKANQALVDLGKTPIDWSL
jgi:uracil DNA glycosylase